MKRSEILIIINIILLIGISGLIIFVWTSSVESYDLIEENKLNTSLNHFQLGIENQEEQITSQARDYAWWDDTYSFMLGKYPAYINDNFNEHTLNNLNIQYVLFIDNNGRLYNETRINAKIPLLTADDAKRVLPLLHTDHNDDVADALLILEDTPFLFCGVPILHTDTTGPVAGTLVFGRRIDATFLASLEETVHHPFSFRMTDSHSDEHFIEENHIPVYPSFQALISNEDAEEIENSFNTRSSDNLTILSFILTRPKTVAMEGREIISRSLVFLIILAFFYMVVMTVILVYAFSRYDKTRDELEDKNKEISMLAEKKRISDNIEKILNTFLRFKPDSRENMQQLINLTAEILHGDCVLYSKIIDGIDTLIASTGLPEEYVHIPDPEGKIYTVLSGLCQTETCTVQSLVSPELQEYDPFARMYGFHSFYGCRVNSHPQNPGFIFVYHREPYQPEELEEVILHLIVNALAVEESRSFAYKTLQNRDLILESVSQAATNLMNQVNAPDFHGIFQMLGEILQVSRVYIRIPPEERRSLSGNPRYEPWMSDVSSLQDLPLLPYYPEWGAELSGWLTELKSGSYVAGSVHSFSGSEKEFLLAHNVTSLALFPFFRKGGLFGILVFEDLQKAHEWIFPECRALVTAATLIGSTFERLEIERLNELYTHQVAEKSHELASMNVELQERSYQVERLLDRKNELITQIGHDIRTPLTPIIGLLPLLRNEVLDPSVRSMIDLIEVGAQRIRLLLDKILLLQNMGISDEDDGYGETGISSLVQSLCDKHADILSRKQIRCENLIKRELSAHIPDKSLNLVLEELLSNAIRFTPDGGTIIFHAEPSESGITVFISDTGIGLSSEDQKRIFDYFYKVDSARHLIDTHGLGLSIVRQIIEKYHGTITVSSEGLGQGTTVSFTLPS